MPSSPRSPRLKALSIVAVVRAAPFVVLALALLATACGDDGAGEPGVSDEAAAAEMCGLLVDWTDGVSEIVNGVEDELVEGSDVRALMLGAVDEVLARTDQLVDDVDALAFPDTPGGRVLAEDVRSGAREAREDLQGFRTEIEAIPEGDPGPLPYRRAQMVVQMEKPRSLVKPDVQDDLGDADLEAAIAAEGDCRFVTRTQ
jgi:hypothetical protein